MGLAAAEDAVGLRDDRAAHDVARRLRAEIVAVKFGGEVVAAVDSRPARSIGIPHRAVRAQAVLLVAAVDAGGGADRPDRLVGVDLVVDAVGGAGGTKGQDQIRIPRGIVIRDEVGAEVVLVGIGVQPTVVVHALAPLAAHGDRRGDPLAVLQAEAASVGGAADPVVETPDQRVAALLGIALGGGKVGRDRGFLVGLAVAIRVAGEPKVGRVADEHAAAQHFYGAHEAEAIHVNGALVHPAVLVGVLEHHDAVDALVFALAVDVGHVAAHLGDPEPAVGVKVEGDGFVDERFGGDDLDAETRRQPESLERFLGRKPRSGEVPLGGGGGFWTLPGLSRVSPIWAATRRAEQARADATRSRRWAAFMVGGKGTEQFAVGKPAGGATRRKR